MTRVAVLGAGSWGTTLANLLGCKGDDGPALGLRAEVVEAINREHENPLFLPGVPLVAAAPGVRATRARRSQGAEVDRLGAAEPCGPAVHRRRCAVRCPPARWW